MTKQRRHVRPHESSEDDDIRFDVDAETGAGTALQEESMSIPLALHVNGEAVSTDVEPRTLLVQLLRETLRLTGTHVGCDTGQCGACTVHLDGRAVKSCTMLALQAAGSRVTTIEGVAAPNGDLHPMQAAFKE